jgi:HAD superfamily hydrolase (TIGR01509 family)
LKSFAVLRILDLRESIYLSIYDTSGSVQSGSGRDRGIIYGSAFRAVVFDLDGTLLDTETLLDEVNDTVLRRHGAQLTKSLRLQFLGRTGKEVNHAIAAEIGADADLVTAERRVMFDDAWARATLMPGAAELIDHFAERGIPMAIATGSELATMRAKLARFPEIARAMQTIVCVDHPPGQRPKPAPDPFLIAAGQLGFEPGDCLAFEDSPPGIASAVSAGMQVVAVGADADPAATGIRLAIASLTDFPVG